MSEEKFLVRVRFAKKDTNGLVNTLRIPCLSFSPVHFRPME